MTRNINKAEVENRYENNVVLVVNDWLEVILKEVPDTMTDEEVIKEFLENPYKFNPIIEGELVWGSGRREHKFGNFMLLSEKGNDGFFEETSNDLEELIELAKSLYDSLADSDKAGTTYYIEDLDQEIVWVLERE